MSGSSPADPATTDAGPQQGISQRRKGPPAWGVVLFLLLMGGLLVVNQFISRSGPPVEWIDGGLDAALKQAKQENKLVFLYLYEPGDPIATRNDRQVFSKRWAREPLADLVCCRVALDHGDLVAAKYEYAGKPAFRLVRPDGKQVSKSDGAITEDQFWTTITDPASRHR